MKFFTLLIVSYCAVACVKGSTEVNQDIVKPLIYRIEGCAHFSGEFNGDHSDRDHEVIAEMNKLKCDTIETDLVAAKEKFKNNPDILKALEQAAAF